MKTILLLTAALLLARPGQAAFGSRDAGTASGQFLKLGADARGAGMGQAVHALSEDANAVYWNPAGLAALRYRHATMTHAAFYQGVFYDYLAYAQPIESVLGRDRRDLQANQLGAVGVAVFYLNAGTLTEVDNTGTPTGGTFSPQDFAAVVAWGGSWGRALDVGVGVKYITSRIHERATTGAVDLGARLRHRFGELPYTASLSIHNLGGGLKYLRQTDPLPLQVVLAQSLRLTRSWVVSADVVGTRDHNTYPCFGMEYRQPLEPNMSAAGRLGWEGRTMAELSGLSGLGLGGGFTIARFGFDYAWLPYGLLGDTHRLSLSYRF